MTKPKRILNIIHHIVLHSGELVFELPLMISGRIQKPISAALSIDSTKPDKAIIDYHLSDSEADPSSFWKPPYTDPRPKNLKDKVMERITSRQFFHPN